MRKNEFVEQTKRLLDESGAQYDIVDGRDGPTVFWWFEEDKKQKANLPMQSQASKHGLANSAAKWKRDIANLKPAHLVAEEKNKWRDHIDNCIADIRAEFDRKLDELKSDVAASTDISLETGSKVDNFMKLFQGACAGASVAQKTLTVASSEAPNPTDYPKIAIPQTPPKAAPKEKESPKGLDALEQVKKEQWAKALARIDEEFEIDDFEGRVLSFLYECKGASAHDLKVSGLWRGSDSVTKFLEDLQADKLVWYFVVDKKWMITNEGIKYLAEEPEDEPEDAAQPAPVATSDIVTQAKPAFNKIEDGLKEALAVAKGEAKPDRVATPQASVVQAKPALTIVPSGPRILKPVEPRISSLKLTYVEKSMVALLQKDMTIGELQKAIGHTSNIKSLANMLYREREDGYIQYLYSEGQVYRITEKGRAYIAKVAPECRTLAAS